MENTKDILRSKGFRCVGIGAEERYTDGKNTVFIYDERLQIIDEAGNCTYIQHSQLKNKKL